MILRELIAELKLLDPEIVFPMGFYSPHSYRGSFDELAFVPVEKARVQSMLSCAEWAIDQSFPGYKGSEYLMTEDSVVRFADLGKTNKRVEAVAWGESDESGDIERSIFDEWKARAIEVNSQ